MSVYDKYESVIGLECHIQLLTKTKMYSSDIAEYGGVPNTHVSVVTLGHPGTLPVVNERAVEFAVKLGIAVHADIRGENQFARKNYFYADLPKGYQITQDKTPICTGGYITSKLKDGTEKQVHLTRIHMEEDAGKSLHDIDPFETLVDLNRAGTPLLEIVTEPDLRTGEEAYAYLTEVRKLVRYLGICDGNMEEGSLRCDANISVMLKGSKVFGKKVEVKNMNSFRNVQRAIDFEIHRQIDLLEAGEKIAGETRSYDAVKDLTFALRSKESANDYRYFPEPDLQPVYITQDYIEKMRANMPTLPDALFKTYTKTYQLSEYDAHQIIDSKEVAAYFDELVKYTSNYKSAANWLMGPVKAYLNENAIHFTDLKVKPATIAAIIALIDKGMISNAAATQKLFPEIVKREKMEIRSVKQANDDFQKKPTPLGPDAIYNAIKDSTGLDPSNFGQSGSKRNDAAQNVDKVYDVVEYELSEARIIACATELDLIQNSDSNELQALVDQALAKFPDKITEYKNGKVGLLGLFVGEVMKLSKGKADPKLLNQLVKETLEK